MSPIFLWSKHAVKDKDATYAVISKTALGG